VTVFAPPIVPPSQQIGRDAFNTPRLKVQSDVIDQIGAMTNPIRTHPKSFKHILQPLQGKVSPTIVLDKTSPTEGKEEV